MSLPVKALQKTLVLIFTQAHGSLLRHFLEFKVETLNSEREQRLARRGRRRGLGVYWSCRDLWIFEFGYSRNRIESPCHKESLVFFNTDVGLL